MEGIRSFYTYVIANQAALVATVCAIYIALEYITRLTPTKSDDSLLSKIGAYVKKAFDLLGVKNNLKIEEVKTEEVKK